VLTEALLRNPCSFTPETPEIIELGPANPAPANDLNALHGGGVEGEDPLDAHAGRDLPNREGLSNTATSPTDANALEGLDSLFFALTDAVEHPDCVPGRKLGHVLAKLFQLNLTQQI